MPIVFSYTFLGLPLHVLLVHFVVVLGPLTAILLVLHALWPWARRRLGFVTPLLGLVIAVLVPITTSAGEALEPHVTITQLVADHVAQGETLTPWAEWMFVATLAVYGVHGFLLREPLVGRVTRPLRYAAIVAVDLAALITAIGFLVDVAIIGDLGARAAWSGVM